MMIWSDPWLQWSAGFSKSLINLSVKAREALLDGEEQ
jgi:hypothetical protein